MLAHGLSRLTPQDISGRVGLDKLIFPDVQEGLEGQRLAESAMTAALGPVAGIGVNALKGLQSVGEGQYLRGLEGMLPTVLRSPMKAFRYGTEGVKDKIGIRGAGRGGRGRAAGPGQAAGFSPSRVRNVFEGKSAVVQHDRALQARRSALVEQFAMAAMAGDEAGKAEAREAVAAFNEKNPTHRIQAMQLAQRVSQRQKRIREAQDGVYLPRARRADSMDGGGVVRGVGMRVNRPNRGCLRNYPEHQGRAGGYAPNGSRLLVDGVMLPAGAEVCHSILKREARLVSVVSRDVQRPDIDLFPGV